MITAFFFSILSWLLTSCSRVSIAFPSERDMANAKSMTGAFALLPLCSYHQEIPWEEIKSLYPAHADFPSSTAYFNQLATEGIAPLGIFRLHGFRSPNGLLREQDNPWCVVQDLLQVETAYQGLVGNGLTAPLSEFSSIPYMFTRNLNIEFLNEANVEHLESSPPYGKSGVLVIYLGKRLEFIPAADIQEKFNVLGLTNSVLRP